MSRSSLLRLFLPVLMVSSAWARAPVIKLKVAAVQFRSSLDVSDNRRHIIEILEHLAEQGVNVAVFPEYALTGYKIGMAQARTEDVVASEERIRLTCQRHRIAAVIGSIYRIRGRTYNTAAVFDSRGNLVERYGKMMLDPSEKWFTPGNHIAYFELEGLPSTVIICHDERYPELVRLPAIRGARMVYYISDESGMGAEKKLLPYRAQMMARAVENTVYVVAANAPASLKNDSGSHGQSRIIQDDGNILKEASFYGEDILVESLEVELEPERLAHPLQGVLSDWWRQGVQWMLTNRDRKLD